MILAKVNPKFILVDHWQTLGSEQGKKRGDVLLFYGAPILGAVVTGVAYCFGWSYPEGVFGSLRNTLSVFTPLLFNVLMLAFYMGREPERHKYPELQARIIHQTYANTAYAILIALACLMLLLIEGVFSWRPWNAVIAALVTALAVNFGLTLFMILKRMHELMNAYE